VSAEDDRNHRASGKEKLRYGLIGVGSMGRGHIGAIKHIEDVEIAAIADPFPPSREKALELLAGDVPGYDDYRQMIDIEQLDAVVVATANHTHAEIICDALQAGLHVLGEKPMSSTIEGCNRILQASSRARGIYQIGLEMRFTAICERMHEIINEDRIGRVRQLWCKEFRGPWAQKVDQWITQRDRSGGALVEKNCHHFDLFNWYVGRRPVRVAAFGTRDLVYGAETFGITPTVLDNAQAVVQYETGAVAALMLCMYCTGYREGLELGIIGTEGWIVANIGPGDCLRMSRRESNEVTTIEFDLPEDVGKTSHKGMVYCEHLAFRDNIRAGRRPLTDAVAGWWATVVPLAAETAVAENRVVDLAELGPFPEQQVASISGGQSGMEEHSTRH